MSADKLGGRIDRDIDAIIERFEQVGRDRIIQDKGKSTLVGHAGDSLQIRDIQLRVANGFGIDGFRLGTDGRLERTEVVGGNELYLTPRRAKV